MEYGTVDKKIQVARWVKAVAEEDCHVSFENLYHYFSSGLLSYVFTITKDREAALDLVQDLFFTIWMNRHSLSAISNIGHYLYSSVKNNAIRYVKKSHRTGPVTDTGELEYIDLGGITPEQALIAREQLTELERTINGLPYKCRLVFRLIKQDGLKYADVAQLLEISVKTVEAHMTLAYGRIMDCLGQMMPEEQLFSLRKKAK